MEIRLEDELSYFRFLAELLNLSHKYENPKKVIRGRELDLLCLMAAGSERFPTLRGAGFKEWLLQEGGFSINDLYRYNSSLGKKGWISDGFIKNLPDGSYKISPKEFSGGIEATVLLGGFDKKTAELRSKIMIDVACKDKGGET